MMLRAALLACLPLLSSMAKTHEVGMLNRNDTDPMVHEPDYLTVAPGDPVRFLATVAGMIPEGGEKLTGKISQEIEVTLDAEGIRGIGCSPHYTHGHDHADSGRRHPRQRGRPVGEILARHAAG